MSLPYKLNEWDEKRLLEFQEYIEPKLTIYNENTVINFIAFKVGDEYRLSKMFVNLNAVKPDIKSKSFISDSLYAGVYFLRDLDITVSDLLEQALSGSIKIKEFCFSFVPSTNQDISIYHSPIDNSWSKNGQRVDRFAVNWSRDHQSYPSYIDWELKSHTAPYANLNELMIDFGVDERSGDSVAINFYAFNVLAIDTESRISKDKAKIGILCANRLINSNIHIGYRVIKDGRVVKRSVINSNEINWEDKATHLYGSAEFDVEHGAILNCFATYDGCAQFEFWVSDPDIAPNTRRSVFMSIDNELLKMRELLVGDGKKSRDFESAVAWLAWMLGFNVAHLCVESFQENVDLIMTTPKGDYLICECTTGLFSTDKLSKLAERSLVLKKKLESSGHAHIKVLPIMVTSKPQDEIAALIDHAERNGVDVICKENLLSLLNNDSFFDYQANKIFDEAFANMERALIKHLPSKDTNFNNFR